MLITDGNYLELQGRALDGINIKPVEESLLIFELLDEYNDKDIVVLKALGHIHYRLKNYPKALHYLLRALEIDPEDEIALKYKAWIYDETGDIKHYVLTLEKLIAADTNDFEVYDNYAEHLENEGFILNALGSYTLALGCDENFHQAIHAAIGGANCYTKLGAYGIAEEIFDTILLEYPNDIFALYGKAYNNYLNNKIVSAENICKNLVSNHPEFKYAKELLNLINKKESRKKWKIICQQIRKTFSIVSIKRWKERILKKRKNG